MSELFQNQKKQEELVNKQDLQQQEKELNEQLSALGLLESTETQKETMPEGGSEGDDLLTKLEDKREDVKENLPEEIPDEKKEMLLINSLLKDINEKTSETPKADIKVNYKNRSVKKFPNSLTNNLEVIKQWGNVNQESSAPVQDFANRLLEAKNEEEASEALAMLVNRSVRYLRLRGEQWHIPGGQGIKRINTVKSLLKDLFSYAADQSAIYIQRLDTTIDALDDETESKESRKLHKKYLKDGLKIFKEKYGLEETEDLKDAIEAQEAFDKEYEGNKEKIISIEETAKEILKNRDTLAFDMRVKRVYSEPDKLDPKEVMEEIETLQIPDLVSLTDREILSIPDIEFMRAEVYVPLMQKLNRMVAFGHITDVDNIQELKAKMRTFDQTLKLYDARVKYIAGVEGAQQEMEQLKGFGLTAEDMTALNLSDIKQEEKERFERFKPLYREIYEKSASSSELKKRRLIFEQGISKREYYNYGIEASNELIKFNKDIFPDGKKVPIVRAIQVLLGYGRAELPGDPEIAKYLGLDEKDLTFTNTPEFMQKIVALFTSEDKEKKFKGYKYLLNNALGIDLKQFEDTSSEEAIFKNNLEKQYLLQSLSQFKKFVSMIEEEGYKLSKDERDKLRALGDMGETINATIGFTQNALRKEGSELFTVEEFLAIGKKTREYYLSDMNAEDLTAEGNEIYNIFSGLKPLMPEAHFLTYVVGSDFKALYERSLAEAKSGEIVAAMSNAIEQRKMYDNKELVEDISFSKRKFNDDLIEKAFEKIDLFKVTPPEECFGLDSVIRINDYETGKVTADRFKAYLDKQKKKASPADLKKIEQCYARLEEYYARYNKYMPYYKAMNELVTSSGFISILNKGMTIGIGDDISPGHAKETISDMMRIATTKEEKETMKKWMVACDKWLELTREDSRLSDKLYNDLFGKRGATAEKEFTLGMTSNQRMVYDRDTLQKMESTMTDYVQKRAEKEKVTVENNRIYAVHAVNLAMLKGKTTEEAYDMYKYIGMKADGKATKEDLKKKQKYIEELFDEIMSWDMKEFSFRVDDKQPEDIKDISENFRSKYMKVHIAMESEQVVQYYKSLMLSKEAKDLTYDKEKMAALEQRLSSLTIAANVYSAKYLIAKYPESETAFGKEFLAIDNMSELMDKISATAKTQPGPAVMAFLGDLPNMMSYKTTPAFKNFFETGDIKKAKHVLSPEQQLNKAKTDFKKRDRYKEDKPLDDTVASEVSEKTELLKEGEKAEELSKEEKEKRQKEKEATDKKKEEEKNKGKKTAKTTAKKKELDAIEDEGELEDEDAYEDEYKFETAGMSEVERKNYIDIQEFYKENKEALDSIKEDLATYKAVTAPFEQEIKRLQKIKPVDKDAIANVRKEMNDVRSKALKMYKGKARDLGIFSFSEDVDYDSLDKNQYTEEKKLEYEKILKDNGYPVGRTRAGNGHFRSRYMYLDEYAQDYVWRPGVKEEVKKAYEWLGIYYTVHDETREKRTDSTVQEKLKMPKYRILLPDAEQIVKEYELQTAGNNCFACAGAEMYRQYCRKEGKMVRNISQNSIRKYRPDIKKFEDYKDLVQSIDPGTEETDFKKAENEVNGYLLRGRVGNIFELGDFFIEKQKDAMLNKVSLYYPAKTDDMTKAQIKDRKIKYHNLKVAFLEKVNEALSGGHCVTVVTKYPMQHYTTIVGIDGKNIKFVDSLESRNGQLNTKPIEEFYLPDNDNGQTLELVWMTKRPANIADIQKEYKNLIINENGEYENKDPQVDEITMVAQTKGVNLSKSPKDMKLKIDGMKEGIYLSKDSVGPEVYHGKE